MKFLIVEDHPIFQQGLSRILRDEIPGAQIGTASTANDAMVQFQAEMWNMVILDLSLPDRSGLEVLKEMKQIHSSIPIMVLTLHAEDRFAVRAFRNGADGYMTKESSPIQLAEAIHKILGGGKYVTDTLAEKLAVQLSFESSQLPHDKLSDREFQVLGLLAQGKSVRSIAAELNLSANTVSTYRARILEKLGVNSTAEVIAYALRNKLTD